MTLRSFGQDYLPHKSTVNWYSVSFPSGDDQDCGYPQNWCDEVDRTSSSLLALDVKPYLEQPASDGNSSNKQRTVKSLFEEEEEEVDEDIDSEVWELERIEAWNEKDTKNWLLSVSQKLGQFYHQISPELVLPGKELLLLSRKEFLLLDDCFGGKLYDSLHGIFDSGNSFYYPDDHEDSSEEFEVELQSNDGSTLGQDSCSTDEESADSNLLSKTVKRRPGRPRNVESKVKEAGPKIWEFIRNLLLNPKYCPDWIRWENYEQRTFRFVDTQKVAEHWGSRNNNQNMNFEKFSRAMRYYYDKDILMSVPRRRLVYKFGPLATGLDKIEFPNFDAGYLDRS